MAQRLKVLEGFEAFEDLSKPERRALEERLELISVARGEYLIRENQPAKAIYFVVTGRFAVLLEGSDDKVAEIGPGQPIGEIAFFSGGVRTASVRAERDSLALRLTESDFEWLAERSPSLWPAVTRTLARRLAVTTRVQQRDGFSRPRTICICRAGRGRLAKRFVAELRNMIADQGHICVLDREAGEEALKGARNLSSSHATQWFNDLERKYETVIYIADHELNAWSEKALHQSDHVILVGWHGAVRRGIDAVRVNALERLAAELHEPNDIRLVLLHKQSGQISGTRIWLDARKFMGMHHHVLVERRSDLDRVFRFVMGRALGLVASGGGAFTAAHIGAYQALQEFGVSFDIMGGTSGGAAMTAAFAIDVPPSEISRRTHDIFVTRKAMGRWTFPRYSLLDHREFNNSLNRHYTDIHIEDLWLPYFAVASNLSSNTLHAITRGPLWEAVRASAAIPALFPPVFSKAGEMLVDGCLMENIPLRTMRCMKHGPNVVLDLEVPDIPKYRVDHRALPSRWNLLWKMFLPGSGSGLPDAPGPHSVLMRSLLRKRPDLTGDLSEDDLIIAPKIPHNANALDWTRHEELRWQAYDYSRELLSEARGRGHKLLVAGSEQEAGDVDQTVSNSKAEVLNS